MLGESSVRRPRRPGIFNVTNSNNRFYFKKTITNKEDFNQITIPEGTYEIESLNDEIKRISIDKGHYTEDEYPFMIKQNFSTLGSIREIQPHGSIIGFVFDDSIRKLLGLNETILYKEYNLSPNPVDILSSDIIFLECDIAPRRIFKGKRSVVIHKFTMDVDPGYKSNKNIRGGVQWYMMEIKDFISSISFKLKNGNNELVSFIGQSITFRLLFKEV